MKLKKYIKNNLITSKKKLNQKEINFVLNNEIEKKLIKKRTQKITESTQINLSNL